MKGLLRLESWIEQLVEEPFIRLFAGSLMPQEVAERLVRAMEDGERVGADGTPEVPGRYRIVLHPRDLAALKAHHPDLEAQLAAALAALAEHMGFRLREPPHIHLLPDKTLPPRTVRITPADPFDASPTQRTQDLHVERVRAWLAQQEGGPRKRAYLIVQGGRIFDLTEPLVHIGRALDNDLILEDRRVSRHHAQLRYRYGRYILQDLGSGGGTAVNGFPVREIVLRPGDRISLAGVNLIYAEREVEDAPHARDTQPMPAGER